MRTPRLKPWLVFQWVFAAAVVWFAANLGKYVPGKVWSIAALSGMARDHGSSAVAAGASSLVMQVVSIATGVTIATAMGASVATGTGNLTIVVAVAGLALFAVLGPVLVPPAVRLASRLSGPATSYISARPQRLPQLPQPRLRAREARHHDRALRGTDLACVRNRPRSEKACLTVRL